MTDEMRVGLIGIAVGRGMTPDEAWTLVDGLQVDGRPLREVVSDLDREALKVVLPGGGFA